MKKFYVALSCILIVGVLRAQSPGGVGTNLSLWLKPDGLTPGALTTWNYSNNSNSFAASPTAPTVVANVFNFLPAVNFNGANYMTGPTGAGATGAPIPAGQKAYSVFAVWSSNEAVGGSNMRVWAQRPDNGTSGDNNFDGVSLFIYPSGPGNGVPYTTTRPTYGDQPEIYPSITGVAYPTSTASTPYSWSFQVSPGPPPVVDTSVSILVYAPGTPYISSMNFLNLNTNDLELMDQNNYAAGPGVTSTDPNASATTNRNISDQGNLLGVRSTAGDEAFNGNLAELIVYSNAVNATQRQQVFSYLSLKYGIPLGGNYLSSGSATIWDATAGGGAYNNSVFGLGLDNGSGLNVQQSNSQTTGGGSGVGQSGKANIILSAPSALTDQGFLIVGSNNAGTGEITTNVPTVAAGSTRLANQWLVQNTGSVGTVNVSVDLTGISTTGTQGTSSDFRLVTDNDGDGNFTTGTQNIYTPTSWTNSNTVANFTAVKLAQNPTVVFAVISGASAGTPLPVNWVNFTAVPQGENVNLNWTVGANEQAKVYEVQRSTDGTNFAQIGEVTNDATVKSYSFVDAGVGSGTYYYRVLEVDLGGASIYSKIVSVNMSAAAFAVKLLNNPTITSNTDPELQVTTNVSGNALMEVWTLSGSRVGSFQQGIGAGTTTLRVPLTSLASGTYAVKVTFNNNTQTLQVIKL